MLSVLGSTYVPHVRRCREPCLSASSALTVTVDLDTGSRELLTFERLLRVKPFPSSCPYGPELFAAAAPLALQPSVSRAVSATLRRRYRELIGRRPHAVLEQICDAQTRLPKWAQHDGNWQLHASEDSYVAVTAADPERGLQQTPPPILRMPSWREGREVSPSYSLPFADGSFDTLVSHGCVPYAVAPLPLFEEFRRILKPGGTLCLTFEGPPPSDDLRYSYLSACDPRSASLAWLQAADGADLLYMVSSFFFYSGGWAELEVTELLPHSPASPAPLYQVVAKKLSNREFMVLKATNDPARRDRGPTKAAVDDASDDGAKQLPALQKMRSVDQPMPQRPQGKGNGAPGKTSPLEPRAPQSTAASRLQDVARASQKTQRSPKASRPKSRPPAAAEQAPKGAVQEDASALVRRRILETIRKGIEANKERSDLEPGEQQMMDHMKMYVMETKLAESQLSTRETELWEEMKRDYLSSKPADPQARPPV